jgi:hypothetical protein
MGHPPVLQAGLLSLLQPEAVQVASSAFSPQQPEVVQVALLAFSWQQPLA